MYCFIPQFLRHVYFIKKFKPPTSIDFGSVFCDLSSSQKRTQPSAFRLTAQQDPEGHKVQQEEHIERKYNHFRLLDLTRDDLYRRGIDE